MYPLPSPFRLREIDPASDRDTAFLAALYRSSRQDLLQMQADMGMIDQLIAMQQRMQEHGYRQAYPQACYQLIEKDGEPAGRLIVQRGQHAMHVIDIVLLPQAQGMGTGAAVLAGLQQHAAANGCSVSLAVNKHNGAAQRLYARLGFLPEGEDALQYQLRWSAA